MPNIRACRLRTQTETILRSLSDGAVRGRPFSSLLTRMDAAASIICQWRRSTGFAAFWLRLEDRSLVAVCIIGWTWRMASRPYRKGVISSCFSACSPKTASITVLDRDFQPSVCGRENTFLLPRFRQKLQHGADLRSRACMG